MPLIKLQIPPGMLRNGTQYQARNRWIGGNLMRFFEGNVTPIGGWIPLYDVLAAGPVDLDGVPRGTLAWQGSTGGGFVAMGTTQKLYIFVDSLFDITPAGFTTGNDNAAFNSGGADYGDGDYGNLLYGRGAQGAADLIDGDVWSLDSFGNFLVGSMFPSDRVLYVWQNLVGTPAAPAPNAPSAARGVLVTPERFLVALGAGDDLRAVAWADRETIDVWTPTAQNQAGGYTLEGTGRIMAGRRARGESLIWTDFSLYSMTFVGGSAVYGFQKRGLECGLVAPNAVAATPSGYAWMGERNFFQYDGYVRPLPSEVGQHVFDNINGTQKYKVAAVNNREFNEITWYYPSGTSQENDSYVTWNYSEDHWVVGTMARTSGFDSHPVIGSVILTAPDGTVYLHENGILRDGVNPDLESGPYEISDGERFVHILQIYPDAEVGADTMGGSPQSGLDLAEVSFSVADYPLATPRTFGPFSLVNPTSTRFNARQVKLLVNQVTPDTAPLWRLGDLRLDVRVGGKR